VFSFTLVQFGLNSALREDLCSRSRAGASEREKMAPVLPSNPDDMLLKLANANAAPGEPPIAAALASGAWTALLSLALAAIGVP
jgi:hypothetical protein